MEEKIEQEAKTRDENRKDSVQKTDLSYYKSYTFDFKNLDGCTLPNGSERG